MATFCPYCNQLQKALSDHNYCSNAGDDMQVAKSNAFYLNSHQLYSGKHISRLSIRGVLNGYQYYKAGRNDRMVNQDNYLIINEGQTWYSEIDMERPIDAIVVAFHPTLLRQAIYSWTTKTEKLLDNPFEKGKEMLAFSENTNATTPQIEQLFRQLKTAIQGNLKNELFFEQTQFELLQLVLYRHQENLKQAQLIPAKKTPVKEELYFRLGIAKDYMLANLTKKLDLDSISRVAALSPFHFLRLFKAVYNITPHQFLTNERMRFAHFLILNSTKSLKDICFDVGFENPSSFGRVFKKYFGQIPSAFRFAE